MYLVCGEALFDVFSVGEKSGGVLDLEAHCGGSPYNVSIGIARLGGRSALLTGMSEDMLGARLCASLERESVLTDYLVRSGRRTTLSMVGIDESGQPEYSFYGLGSADCGVTEADLPEMGQEVIGCHFGSYSLVVKPVADAFAALLSKLGDRFVSLDPNVRLNVEPDLAVWKERIAHYAARADLLKTSAEDIDALYPDSTPAEMARRWLEAGVKLVIITDGGAEVLARTQSGLSAVAVPEPTETVDTVGAGDSFQAAVLTKLFQDGKGDPRAAIESLDSESLADLLEFATRAARITCMRRGADLPRAADMRL